MVYGTYNYSYWGESKPTYNWGASHCTSPCHPRAIAGRLCHLPLCQHFPGRVPEADEAVVAAGGHTTSIQGAEGANHLESHGEIPKKWGYKMI